jgi:hypothetical protein
MWIGLVRRYYGAGGSRRCDAAEVGAVVDVELAHQPLAVDEDRGEQPARRVV